MASTDTRSRNDQSLTRAAIALAVATVVAWIIPVAVDHDGAGWTRDERIHLWHHLRQVASLSPYLIVLLAPGSMVLLPVVAWWLDRRRGLRALVTLKTEAETPPVM